jgi:branched-chain amino acid transport system substrate-binding protein
MVTRIEEGTSMARTTSTAGSDGPARSNARRFRRGSRWIEPIALVAVTVTLAACGSGGSASASGANKTVTVATVLGLTGPAAPYGEPELKAAQLAVADINAAGGVNGHKFALVVKDDQSDATKSVAATRQLAPNYPFVNISTLSTNAQQDFPVLKQLQVVGVDPALSVTAAATDNQPWAFGTSGTLDTAVDQGLKAWIATAHPTSVSIIMNQADAASTKQAKIWQTALTNNGVNAAQLVQISSSTVDFGATVASALKNKPSAVLVSALAAQAGSIVVQLHNSSPQTQILETTAAMDLPTLQKAAPQAGPGVISIVGYDPDFTAGATAFDKAYTAKYGSPPGNETVAGEYELIYIIAQAVKQGIPLWENSATVRAQFQKYMLTLDYTGAFGHLTMNPTGNVSRTQFLVQVSPDFTLKVLAQVQG